MAEKIKFASSIGGYKKKEVNEYIQKQQIDLEDLKMKYEEVLRLKNESDIDRDRITKIFIKAQEKAEVIVQEAEKEAALKRKQIEDEIDKNREILRLLKEELEFFKNKINRLLRNFEKDTNTKEEPVEAVKKETENLDMEFDRIDDDFKIDDDFETI